jgi:hypothetical protein
VRRRQKAPEATLPEGSIQFSNSDSILDIESLISDVLTTPIAEFSGMIVFSIRGIQITVFAGDVVTRTSVFSEDGEESSEVEIIRSKDL